MSHLQSTTISILFLVLYGANAFFWQNTEFGLILLSFFVIFFGLLFGKGLIPDEPRIYQWAIGFWILLSVIMIAGSIAYYIDSISPLLIHSMVFFSVPVSLFVSRKNKPSKILSWLHDHITSSEHRISKTSLLAHAFILLGSTLTILTLASSQTTEPIRSLWQIVPSNIFLIFFFASLFLVALLYRGKEHALLIFSTIVVLFTLLSAATIIFPIGYGFDTFIHQSTEQHIAQHGQITPKPLYYIGQYTLTLFSHHGFSIPVKTADIWLLPILAALFIPIFWLFAASHLATNRRLATASLIGIFLIPLTSFIITTPQGLANLWTLLAILSLIPFFISNERPRLFILAIPALAALLTHPIAGIPLVLLLTLAAADPARFKGWKKILVRLFFWSIALLGSIVLPASFLINSALSGNKLAFDLQSLTTNTIGQALNLGIFLENRFEPILDFVYLYGFNAILILVILAIIGWIKNRQNIPRSFYIFTIMTIMLVINYIILSTTVEFSFLIDYERQNYATRLIPLAIFMLIPFVILGLNSIVKRLHESPLSLRLFSLILTAAVITSVFYLTYPRHDSLAVSRGFNVSQHDQIAVRFIDDLAGEQPYMVLANQSVSAASVQEFGFAHYYGELFFYPIPTGGAVYDYFLRMNDQGPSKQLAQEATGVITHHCKTHKCDTEPKILFYVVNDYWWQSKQIIEKAKITADDWYSIDNGKIHVFKYEF